MSPGAASVAELNSPARLVGALAAMDTDVRDQALAGAPEQVAIWIRAAAAYGLAEGQLCFGRMLLEGQGVGKDEAKALGWFRQAAEAGDPDALNMVGRCLETGWGAPADLAEAAHCYRRAAEAGYAWAQYNLGHACLDGCGTPRDPGEALHWYRAAAEQGHPPAMNLVARCVEQGWGAPSDPAAAYDWYRRSAEGGYFRGQYNFGLVLIEEGRLDEGLFWLGKALEIAPSASRAVMIGALKVRTEKAVVALAVAADASFRCS